MLGLSGRKHRSRRKRKRAFAIVPAILKDANGIANVMKDAFPGDASYYKVRSWEIEARKMMRSHIGWISFVSLDKGAIVGVIAARHIKKRAVPTIRIEWLAVHSSQRGRGLGKALLAHLIKWIKTTFPEPKVRLTLRARTAVQDFYRKLGFRHFGSGWMKMVAKK